MRKTHNDSTAPKNQKQLELADIFRLYALIRKLIDADATLPEKINESISEMMLRLTGIDISCCPKCKKGKMIRIRKLPIQDDLNLS